LARILVVEDDVALSRGLVAVLVGAGYVVDTAFDGESALEMAADEPYALIILDVGLPDISGFDILQRLRRHANKVPIMLLTARDAVEDKVAGLDYGADDYMLKPFDAAELVARMRALLRRSEGEASPIRRIGSLAFDPALGSASVAGRTLSLRRREWAVLERLIARAGKVVSKERLTSEVFGYDDPVAPNAIEVYIARLRKKLEPDGPEIRTLRGFGYLLDAGPDGE
jgi:two-component system response regulator TctD